MRVDIAAGDGYSMAVLEDGFNGLEMLDYARHEWGDEHMASLASTLLQVSCPHVTRLDLSWNDVSAAGLDVLGQAFAMGALSGLKSLDLSRCTLIRSLPESIGELAELEAISLEGCVGLAALPAALGKLVCLRELNVKQCHLLEPQVLAATLPKTVRILS